MCLVVGVPGSGKTLLLKRLQALCRNPGGSTSKAPFSPTGGAAKASSVSLANNTVGPAAPSSPTSPSSLASGGFPLPDAPPTMPTVGTNLVKMALTRKMELTLRELGGAMAPIWQNYLSDCQSLVYVVDLSNTGYVSASCIQLLELLSNPHLAKKPVLIVLNKTDAPSRLRRNEYASIVRLDDLMHHAQMPITVIEASAMTGAGLGAIQQWLIDNHCGRPGS